RCRCSFGRVSARAVSSIIPSTAPKSHDLPARRLLPSAPFDALIGGASGRCSVCALHSTLEAGVRTVCLVACEATRQIEAIHPAALSLSARPGAVAKYLATYR